MREETEERKSVSCALRSFRSFRSFRSLSLSANACYYVSKRDAYVRCICVRVCVCVFILPTDEEFSEVRFKERSVPEERKEETRERQKNRTKKKEGER